VRSLVGEFDPRYSRGMSKAALSEFLRGLAVDKEVVINKASRGMLQVIFRPWVKNLTHLVY